VEYSSTNAQNILCRIFIDVNQQFRHQLLLGARCGGYTPTYKTVLGVMHLPCPQGEIPKGGEHHSKMELRKKEKTIFLRSFSHDFSKSVIGYN
jgi:hypothetical protein